MVIKKYKQMDSGGNGVWQLQEAKACFSELVRRAEVRPQRVTVRGKDAVVVLSERDYERLCPESKTSLTGLMGSSPLADVPFGEQGDRMPVREVDL